MLKIREERREDILAIHLLDEEAFGQRAEADLVGALRQTNSLTFSLVAELDKKIVGHIAFSPVTIEDGQKTIHALALAPMAVLPAHQQQGIGKAMIHYWLENCAKEKDNLVVVVGHPEYYPKFGFVPAKPYGIKCEYDVPEEASMVLELKKGALKNIKGTVRFHRAFDDV